MAALDGVTITVGSKDFTEHILLGYMAELALSAAGADVSDLTTSRVRRTPGWRCSPARST